MATEQSPTELLIQVRQFVHGLLDAEEHPAQVSYSLAYVAAELGFVLTDNSITVLPVVLDALSQAAKVMAERAVEEAEESVGEDSPSQPIPEGKPKLTIVH